MDHVDVQREIAVKMLVGYRAHAVDGGEAALDFLRRQGAGLLVLDMILGHGMDGLETYRAVLAEHPGQRAIIASGFSETERVQEAQRPGAGSYVRKPCLIEKRGLAVRRELDRPTGSPSGKGATGYPVAPGPRKRAHRGQDHRHHPGARTRGTVPGCRPPRREASGTTPPLDRTGGPGDHPVRIVIPSDLDSGAQIQ